MSDLKIGSLFSGYGGLDMAVESVTGARTAWVSDIDKGACKILAHRYPDVPNLGDLTAIDWDIVEPVDIITGGFPCQDLSHAGKRAGMTSDSRSGLWSYMCEAINIIRPRLVVAENVRGLLSAQALRRVEPCTWCVGDESEFDVRALGAVLADLADIGYDSQWVGIRASDVGACHGRFRVFLVAYPRGVGGFEALEHDGRGASATHGASVLDERDRDARGAGPERTLTLLPTPRATDGSKGGPNQRGSSGDLMLPSAVTHLRPTLADEIEHLLPTPSVADAMGGHERRGGVRSDELLLNGMAKAGHLERFGQYADAIARWEYVVGREAPAPTEPTGRGGTHRLSPAFTEWMMGLPAGWITDVPGITRNEALKACGNGVVPQQAAAALRHMLAASEVAA